MKAKLSMSVDRVPMADGNPLEWRGKLRARICVSNVDGHAYSVDFISDDRDLFELQTITAAFRNLTKLFSPPDPPLLVPEGYDPRPGAVNHVD
jgi:hypothetical protein